MRKHRIFIAINLPQDIKKKLLGYQRERQDLPVRWTKPDNLHFTLVFIGYVGEDELLEICKLSHQATKRHKLFNINLEKILLGPPNRPARMIWVEGESSQKLADLKSDLEKSLFNSVKSGYKRQEVRAFRPHITLARIKQWEWERISPEPKINLEIAASFPVESIEVMESELKRTGAEYTILESIKLGNL